MGFGQCMADRVAARQFNTGPGRAIPIVYGCISNGLQWQVIKLEATAVTIDSIVI